MKRRSQNMILQLSVGILICFQIIMGNSNFNTSNLLPPLQFLAIGFENQPRPAYDIRFTAIDGSQLEAPLYFSKDGAELLSLSEENAAAAQTLINRIGTALVAEKVSKAQHLSDQFQTDYLDRLDSASYEIIIYPFSAGHLSGISSAKQQQSFPLLAFDK